MDCFMVLEERKLSLSSRGGSWWSEKKFFSFCFFHFIHRLFFYMISVEQQDVIMVALHYFMVDEAHPVQK